MLLADLPRLLLRRWPVLILGVVAAVFLGSQAAQESPPRQQMTASTVLLPPAARESTGPNPYLALGGLESTADVVARRVVTDGLERELEDAGVESFEVVYDSGSAAPIVVTTVVATTAEAAEEGIALLVEAVPTALRDLQRSASVDDADLITTKVVAAPSEPTVLHAPQVRAVLVTVGACLVLTLAAAVLLDLLASRTRRREDAAAEVRARILARAAERRERRDAQQLRAPRSTGRNGPDQRPAGTGT